MSVFPNPILRLSYLLKKVGKYVLKIEQSKFILFMKRNKLFSLIPLAFLSWQLAVTRTVLEHTVEQEQFYKNRLETYFRDWEEIQFGLWEKLKVGERYVFLGVNDTYVKNFLLPNGMVEADLIGKDNVQAMGIDVGLSWRLNDSIVAYTGRQVHEVELARYGDRNGQVFISKWRKIRRNGDTTIVGMAIKMDTINKLYIKALKK